MIGKELHLRQIADRAWDQRWTFVTDVNGDGMLTISDANEWIRWIFFAPGDWVALVAMKHLTPVALFFEITPTSLYGWGAGTVAAVLWLCAIGLAFSVYESLAEMIDSLRNRG